MGWRSVVITQPAALSLGNRALQLRQDGQQAQIPLEDISVLVIDQPQVTLTAQVLTACAEQQIAVITVGADHHPNGVLLPFTPHSRALKVVQQQMAIRQPLRKQLHQLLIQQKIRNQAELLAQRGHVDMARRLDRLADEVRSGDSGRHEAQAAQVYFRALYGNDFTRGKDRFYNAGMNYGYAVLRAALARSLVSYGFLPMLGLFHCNEQNAFNLADDLIEPYRPMLDWWLLKHYPTEPESELARTDKATLVSVLHWDISLSSHADGHATALLAAIEATVISLGQSLQNDEPALTLPCLQATLARSAMDDESDE